MATPPTGKPGTPPGGAPAPTGKAPKAPAKLARKKPTQVEHLADKVLGHMASYNAGSQAQSILLGGDPGIGKTTFVKEFSKLVGIPSIIIEVPHITEEHMINIPFIVFDPQTGTEKSDSLKLVDKNSPDAPKSKDSHDYKLVLAQSNLYTQIISKPPLNDAKYVQDMLKMPSNIQQIYANLGGTTEKIPEDIAEARHMYRTILFLDEFFRATSMRIRNILRDLLNHQLGMHNVPKNVYIIYASNMSDSGGTVEEKLTNTDFQQINFKAPRKDEWFDWLESQCETKYNIELNPTIMNKFKKLLKDEDISFTDRDIEGGVRTSPRRWEQILLYINASLPTDNKRQAQALMTNIRNNFLHYEEGKHSKLAPKVVKAVAELIEETSGIDIDPKEVLPSTDWRIQLGHMIDVQKKLGEHRKHIPVLSGPPGIGKTSFAATVAREHGLILINVSCDKLSPEDVLGMPLPSNKIDPQHPDIDVQFSEPPLYKLIMNKIEDGTKELQRDLQKQDPSTAAEKFAAFQKQRYKYLIFFDEMNRPESPKTFNGLRRVILEKDFGPAGSKSGEPLELPKEAITMAAINPKGTGIQQLTEHFRDVSDFIEADATWPELKKWMKDQKPADLEKVGTDVRNSAMHIIDEFVEKFKMKGDFPLEQAPFYLEGGAAEPIYVSSRRYMGLYSTLCRYMSRALKKLLRQPDITPDEVREGLDDQVFEAIEEMINHSLHQAGIISEAPEFLEPIRAWVTQLPASVYGGLLTTKIHHHASLADVMKKYLTGSDPIKMPEDSHLQNLNDSVDDSDVIDQFRNLIEDVIKESSDVKKYVLDKTEDEIVMNGDKLQKNPGTKVSHLENFSRTLMYTLHKLEYSNSRVQIIGKAVQNAVSRLYDKLDGAGKLNDEMKDEFEEFVPKFRMRLLKLFKDLPQ